MIWEELADFFREHRRPEGAKVLQEAIAEAVAAEREACARVADAHKLPQLYDPAEPYDVTAGHIAKKIRQRGETTAPVRYELQQFTLRNDLSGHAQEEIQAVQEVVDAMHAPLLPEESES